MLQNFSVFTTTAATADRIPDCSTVTGKREAAILHSITDLKYNKYIEFHYGTGTPKQHTISHKTIFDEINATLPGGGGLPNHLQFVWDSATDTITFSGKPLPYDPTKIEYSVCLFEGIDILDSVPDAFIFVKARDKRGRDTLVFKTVKGTSDLHFYDLSNDKP